MAKRSKPAWDAAPKEPRSDAKLKKLPDAEQEAMWLLLNPTDLTTPPYTLEALAVYIQGEHDIEVSLSTVSEWRSWYSLKRRMERAAERATQAKLELAKDPSFSAEDIDRAAQIVFMTEAMEGLNVKAYVQLAKLRLSKEKHDLERDRLSLASKNKVEQGLAALAQELKGNKRAAKIFAELQEELSRK
jgi:hypothetical protein